MQKTEYIKIGDARDITDKKERLVYRFFEILPGTLAWLTLLGVIFLSWRAPVFIAFFIIAFDIYWLLKTMFLSLHLRAAFGHMRQVMAANWLEKLKQEKIVEPFLNWQDVYHLVILPFYKESYEVVAGTFESLVAANYPKEKIIVVLAAEKQAGENAKIVAQEIGQKYSDKFFKFLITYHPVDKAGEIAGKGSNETWAGRQAKTEIIDKLKIPYGNILVSVFDIDSVIFRDYFARLTYVFLQSANRTRCSFQPIPVFNNNIWDAPSFSRVVAQSGTFWHMMQQERPERLATFSSHAMNFETLVEMDFWTVKNVSEDSRIFWQSLLFYDGDYRVVPLNYPVSMDANLADNVLKTILNVYRQQRRWGWGVENIPYLLFGFWQNKKIPLRTKIFWGFNHLEGFWSWATNALIIFMLGWLPPFLGGQAFNVTLLSYSLPQITRLLMTLAMVGLVSSAIYGLYLLPPLPHKKSRLRYFFVFAQWILMPVTIIIFGSLPGLEAQTRLMFGKYMGFWVTPKMRS
jgi:cellulose synthase/poly-beta-1,6-N-acetylglucosamine synthase-like glycosyltransferase